MPETIVTVDTTTRELNCENGASWLGLPSHPDILSGKSAFKLIQAHGLSVFNTIHQADHPLRLHLNGKMVRDPSEVLSQIERRVGSGEVERGSCSLCFDEMPRSKLVAACGRSGCNQRVNEECLRQWVRLVSSVSPQRSKADYFPTIVWRE